MKSHNAVQIGIPLGSNVLSLIPDDHGLGLHKNSLEKCKVMS